MKTRPVKTPNNIDAERAVLGAILCDPDVITSARTILQPDDFYQTNHCEIFRAMVTVAGKKDCIPDLLGLSDYLRDSGRLDKIGGGAYLAELADSCPSSAAIKHHAKIVKGKSDLRKTIAAAREIAVQASEPGADPSQIPTKLSIDLSRNAEINQVSQVIHALNQNIDTGYPGLYPGYEILRRTIRKMAPGHLWVAGAYTSVGKSAWLVDLICRLYRQGADNPGIAVFSTEMSCEQYLLRALSNHTSIPSWVITENKCKPEQTARLIQAQVWLSKCNLYLYDRIYKIEDIERTARMLKEARLDVLCIDYIQNLWGEGTIYDRMSRLAPILQYLAKDLQITIIALSQVSNQFQREKGSCGVFGYKGAGEIAASADLGIELERDKNIPERMIFKVSKNRHGKTSEGVLEYVNNFTRFEEVKEGEKEE